MNRVALLTCISLLSAICACTSPSAKPDTHETPRSFDIAAGSAPTALTEFSRQSDKQVLFDYVVLRDRQTHAVEGTLKPSEALKSMLKGTGLVARNVNELTVAIVPN